MGKAAAVAIAMILGWAAVAPATPTLEITGGSASGNNVATVAFEPDVNVSGPGFTMRGASGTTFVNGAEVRFFGSLVLNGVSYPGTCNPGCIDNTVFSFTDTFDGPTPLVLFLYHGPYFGTFTMTGHTELAGGVDFVGHGTVTLGWIFQDDAHTRGFQFERWEFAAPEPPSLVLLSLGVGTVLVGVAQRLNDRKRRT
jgi:hypothetical protein